MAIELETLVSELDELLLVGRFKDYCPNGLQVEGRPQIEKLVTGVTASMALLESAIEAQADAVLVHHGYFWRGEDARLTGMKQKRVKALMDHNVSLLAYHLPLDAHPELGNNATLGRLLEFETTGELGPGDINLVGSVGRTSSTLSAAELASHIGSRLGRAPLVIEGGEHAIERVAWCTGGAQNYIEQAWLRGVDAYISGEVSEQTFHQAKELGIHYFAAGHHATERYGVQALGQYLADNHGLSHQFIDIDNPV